MQSRLTLSTKLRGCQTVLDNCFVSPPLKLLTLPPEADGTLKAVQMSSSPGLLAGDHINIDLTLAADTALHLSTQAFTRVLEMAADKHAEQHTRITLGEGSHLTYLPHPLVLHRNSTLFQSTDIVLADGCTLAYGDITAAGRILNNERFAFARFSSQLTIRHHERRLLCDNIQWQPQRHPLQTLGQMEDYTHQANLFYVDTGTAFAPKTMLNRLHDGLAESFSDGLLWGISLAADNIICLRALAYQAEPLQQLLQCSVDLLRHQPSGHS